MHLGTASRYIRQARILTNPEPSTTEKSFCIEYGFSEPELLEIKQPKLLK